MCFKVNTTQILSMKFLKPLLWSFVLAFSFSACSPYTLVNSETYNDADLSAYSTFRIITPDQGTLAPGMASVTYYNIAAAIREQMLERGYTESPQSPLLINIGITTHRELQTEPLYQNFYPYYGPAPIPRYAPFFMYPRQYYWPQAANAQVITGIYKEGVLTMDMVNIDQHIPLYSASVATILSNGGQGNFRNLTGISEAVATLFSRFPVPLLPQYRTK